MQRSTDKTHYMVFYRAKFKSTNKDIYIYIYIYIRDIKIKRVTSVNGLSIFNILKIKFLTL